MSKQNGKYKAPQIISAIYQIRTFLGVDAQGRNHFTWDSS